MRSNAYDHGVDLAKRSRLAAVSANNHGAREVNAEAPIGPVDCLAFSDLVSVDPSTPSGPGPAGVLA